MKDPRIIALGQRLREERIKKQDTQSAFAARVGVSVPTLRKMEEGDTSVHLKYWVGALDALSRGDDISGLLAQKESLFTKIQKSHGAPKRQRVSRKKQK